jgi:uncharacterized membrane protein
MKNIKLIPVILVMLLSIVMYAFITEEPNRSNTPQMPDNVKAVIENKCFGCHNTGSKNDDAKDKLDFKKLDSLSDIKKISAYKHISEELSEDKMTPKKFLEKQPDKKLTDEEKKLLIEWGNKEAENLVKSKQ